jgi:hypothetical protein
LLDSREVHTWTARLQEEGELSLSSVTVLWQRPFLPSRVTLQLSGDGATFWTEREELVSQATTTLCPR